MSSRRRGWATALAGVVCLGGLAVPAAAHHPTGALSAYDWACPAGTVPEDGFVDVPASNPHEEAIDCAVAQGLARGTGPGTYSPLTNVTRGQLATFVSLLPDGDPETYAPPGDAFDDDDGNVHEAAINELARQGVVKGTGPRQYSPHALVTRAQMAAYLVRAYELATRRTLPQARDHFADDAGTTHERAINTAASLGLAAGVGNGSYQPAGAVRRDQMARFLTRTWGCSRFQPRDGQHHDPRCDRYTDTEGLQALQGFDVSVSTARHHGLGQPVAVQVQACNRRSTPLHQTFPQKDWFVLGARHQQLGVERQRFDPEASARTWYDHRNDRSLDGAGYRPFASRDFATGREVLLERDPDAVFGRFLAQRPHLQAVTWHDGPQAGPAEVVVWQPGECKSLDVGDWRQAPSGYAEDMHYADFPRQWRHLPRDPAARVVPGWYVLRLEWGGVEVGQTRRYLTVDSPPLNLDGPRVTATTDKAFYAVGEPVEVTVRACNDSDLPYREDFGGGPAFTASAVGNLGGAAELGTVEAPPGGLAWEPGQCLSWSFRWDQRYSDGRSAARHERIEIGGSWNRSGGRPQRAQGAGIGVS